jgi:Flp pilus assembly pilin Flp
MITLLQWQRTVADTLGRELGDNMQNFLLKLQAIKDTRGQDLIEYALMAGFVAVAAGAVMPGVASSISTIFSKVGSVMAVASTQGS